MITRPLDTIFCSADRMRDAGADLLRQVAPGGRLHRSLTDLMAALDQFDAALTVGSRNPGQPLAMVCEESKGRSA
jgi:hypothetical protein